MLGNRGFVAAWLAGLSIVIWRDVHKSHRMPVPGALLGISALFAGLAIAADIAPRAGGVITLGAWGLDIAALFSALPAGLGGQLNQAADVSHSAEAGPGKTAQAAPATTGG
jgi:hypothetical protein